jgi:hypothetical protein|tara:strand:+ start:389 stop:589 length:201 start_codon:yes stop_codon:yes gene_type:complete
MTSSQKQILHVELFNGNPTTSAYKDNLKRASQSQDGSNTPLPWHEFAWFSTPQELQDFAGWASDLI